MSKHSMSKHARTPVTIAVGAALVGGLALASSAFAMQPLAQGYALGATMNEHGGEKASEGKCGEGRCGMAKMDSDQDGRISSTEFATAHDGDASKFAAHDPDGDGFITAAEMEAQHAAKTAGEGKCGEGKCGAAIETPAAAADEAATEGDDEVL